MTRKLHLTHNLSASSARLPYRHCIEINTCFLDPSPINRLEHSPNIHTIPFTTKATPAQLLPKMSSQTNYGTYASEKTLLPVYHSRASTDSTASTEALLQKQPKKSGKDTKKTPSSNAVMKKAFKNSMQMSV
ncbi:hypothetical protein P154DRAFT_367196 [Amniculicola lignicola CBS 123094]|uniref:Uncharacterized protein n=1 Tax=Amniculicola lignicola CBS 123094 TaxID=1392246 RepID=A0A6A5W026_9PLEO|nr:hypothetical protein P154DRAFT_367196 [Amniculicola lignicola CBS 123094]